MKIEVNLEKKHFFGIMGLIVVIAGLIGVYAYNSVGVPSTFGHSANELEVALANGTVVNLQTAVSNGWIGVQGVGSGSSSVSALISSEIKIPFGSNGGGDLAKNLGVHTFCAITGISTDNTYDNVWGKIIVNASGNWIGMSQHPDMYARCLDITIDGVLVKPSV